MTESTKLIHFLLVEDENDHADLILMSLDHNNFSNTMDRVSDGVGALDYLYRRGDYANAPRPDVILLDLNLPKLNGLEVLDQIKSDKELRAIPVVIMTTSANNQDRMKAYQNSANSFLTKPADFTKFQKMIRDLNLYWSVWNQPPVFTAE